MGNTNCCQTENRSGPGEGQGEIVTHYGETTHKVKAGPNKFLSKDVTIKTETNNGERFPTYAIPEAQVQTPIGVYQDTFYATAQFTPQVTIRPDENPKASIHEEITWTLAAKTAETESKLPIFTKSDQVDNFLKNYDDGANTKLPAKYIDEEKTEIYEGDWDLSTNTYNGYGILVKSDGSKMEGYWAQNKLNGPGRHINAGGDCYEGTYKDGQLSGFGTYVQYDSNSYKGNWSNGKMNGEGEENFSDGRHFKGTYVDGLKTGEGRFTWEDGSYYQGNFLNNTQHGEGEYQWSDNRHYKGQWVNGQMEGTGRFSFPDGTVYEGQFLANKKHGFGKCVWNEGKYYEGQWVAGVQEGKGKYVKNGNTTYGDWQGGKLLNKLNQTESVNTISVVAAAQ